MSLKSIAFLPVFLLVAFVGQGCNQTCQQLCLANADYVTGCLEAWDAQWSDFGYDGLMPVAGTNDLEPVAPAEEYRLDCVERYRVALSAGTLDGQTAVRLGCAEDLDLLAASVGCNEYFPSGFALDPTQ